MPFKLRILSAANRVMQRPGFLKPLCALATRTDTSNLSTMGRELIASVIKRVHCVPPYSAELRDYVHKRLTDRVYAELRKLVLKEPAKPASFELQDLYLADSRLVSNTGKLVEKDWRFYPPWATALDLIRPGTYSAMTRTLTFLSLTPKEELAAFEKFDIRNNPLLLNREQAALLLFCFIDNDAEIIRPLFENLLGLPTRTTVAINSSESPTLSNSNAKIVNSPNTRPANYSSLTICRLSELAGIVLKLRPLLASPA